MDTMSREHPRKNLFLNLEVFYSRDQSLAGYLLDISEGGIRLASKEPKNIGEMIRVDVPLPEEIIGEDYLQVAMTCIWCKFRKGTANPYYESGFEFDDLDEENAEMVNALINHLTFKLL